MVGVHESGPVTQPGQVGERPHVLRHYQPGPAVTFPVAGVDERQRPAPAAPPPPAAAAAAPPSAAAAAAPSAAASRRRRRRRGIGLVVRRRRADVVETAATAPAAGATSAAVVVVVRVSPRAAPSAAVAVRRWRPRDLRVGHDDRGGRGVGGCGGHDDAAAVRAGQQQLPRAGRGRLQQAPVAAHAQQAVVAAAPAAAPLGLDKLPEAERVADAGPAGGAAQTAGRGRVVHVYGRGRGPAEYGHDGHAAAQLRAGHVDRPQRPAAAVAGAQRVRVVVVQAAAAAAVVVVVGVRDQAAKERRRWRRQRWPGEQPAQRFGRGRLVLTLAVW